MISSCDRILYTGGPRADQEWERISNASKINKNRIYSDSYFFFYIWYRTRFVDLFHFRYSYELIRFVCCESKFRIFIAISNTWIYVRFFGSNNKINYNENGATAAVNGFTNALNVSSVRQKCVIKSSKAFAMHSTAW